MSVSRKYQLSVMTLLSVLFVSVTTHARTTSPEIGDVPVLQGIYQYQGQFEVWRNIEKIEVNVETEQGENKVDELLELGYQCSEMDNNKFVCTKWLTTSVDDPDLADKIAVELKNEHLDFRAIFDPTEMFFRTEFARSFHVHQKLLFRKEHILTKLIYNWASTPKWWLTLDQEEQRYTYELRDEATLVRDLRIELLKSEDEITKVTNLVHYYAYVTLLN